MDTLAICRTCPRDTAQSGAFGVELKARIRDSLDNKKISILMVQCLGSCRSPCAVALDGPGKARIRFSSLTVEDAGALVQAALRYEQSDAANPSPQTLPVALQARISAIAPKYRSAKK